MNKSKVSKILNQKWLTVEVNFININEVKKNIPNKPGLYSIKTNAEDKIFEKYGSREDKKHYNLRKKTLASKSIPQEFLITQEKKELYCVYNGHHSNLRQRLSEHFKGSSGTACLALFTIKELRNYKWTFSYLQLDKIPNYVDCKLFRTILEQHLRAKTGWPILCSQ